MINNHEQSSRIAIKAKKGKEKTGTLIAKKVRIQQGQSSSGCKHSQANRGGK